MWEYGQAGSLNCGSRFDFCFDGHKTSWREEFQWLVYFIHEDPREGCRERILGAKGPGSQSCPGGIPHDEGHEEKQASWGVAVETELTAWMWKRQEGGALDSLVFLLGIHVNGSSDCSRTELLSSGVTHFKFMLCRDLDFIPLSPGVHTATLLPSGLLHIWLFFQDTFTLSVLLTVILYLLFIGPQAFFFSTLN